MLAYYSDIDMAELMEWVDEWVNVYAADDSCTRLACTKQSRVTDESPMYGMNDGAGIFDSKKLLRASMRWRHHEPCTRILSNATHTHTQPQTNLNFLFTIF